MRFGKRNLLCDFGLQYPVRSKKCLGTDSSAENCAPPSHISSYIFSPSKALRNPAPSSSVFRNKTPTAILNGKLHGIKPQIILPCSMQINKTKKRGVKYIEEKWRKIHCQHSLTVILSGKKCIENIHWKI